LPPRRLRAPLAGNLALSVGSCWRRSPRRARSGHWICFSRLVLAWVRSKRWGSSAHTCDLMHVGTHAHTHARLEHSTHDGIALNSHDCCSSQGGQTALAMAAIGGNTGVVSLLIAHRADVGAKDCDGLTALDWSGIMKRSEVSRLLEQATSA
jgi:hypothetical protein